MKENAEFSKIIAKEIDPRNKQCKQTGINGASTSRREIGEHSEDAGSMRRKETLPYSFSTSFLSTRVHIYNKHIFTKKKLKTMQHGKAMPFVELSKVEDESCEKEFQDFSKSEACQFKETSAKFIA